MKKLAIVLIVIIIAGVGIGIFLKAEKEGVAIEDILPQDPLIYVQLRDVEQNLEKMASMPFWQGIQNIDYDLLIKKNALSQKQKVFIDLIKNQFSEVLTNPLAKRLLGREIAFAIYPPDQDIDLIIQEMKFFNPKAIEELLSGLFFVTRIDPDVQIAEFISRFFNQYGANISKGQVEYKGQIIHTVSVVGVDVKFGIVRLEDLLVVGIGEKAARMSIDVFKKGGPALAGDPKFTRAQAAFLDSFGLAGFFNFETFTALVKGQMEKLIGLGAGDADGGPTEAQVEQVFAQISGFKAFSFSGQLTPLMQFDSQLIFDPKALSAEYAPIYTCPPEENQTIRFVPEEILGYQWSNCFELDYYWGQVKKELAHAQTPASKVNDFEEKIGLSIEEDILPTFGNEIGGYLADIQIGGFFPIPKLLLFVEIKDKSKAEHLLSRLKEQPFVMLQEENYHGTPIKYLALPLGENVQPGYAFLGDYLLITTSRQLLKSSINAFRGSSTSLLASPDFKEINFGLTDKNRSIQFVKVGQIIEKIKGVIGWSNQWMASRDQKAQAFKAGSEKPLEEARASSARKEGELKDIRKSIILLEDDIWSMETKGLDVSAKKAELSELKNSIDAKKLEISDAQEREAELENILQKPKGDGPDPALRQLYVDEVVYPILESFKSIKSYGLRVTVDNDVIESSVFLKIEE